MKLYLNLTENEFRALQAALFYGPMVCTGTCVYPEMQTKKTDCVNCPYTKALDRLRKKFSKPKSLEDHDKQVRKQVSKETYEKIVERSDKTYVGYAFNLGKDVYAYTICDNVLDEILKGDIYERNR